MRSRPLYLDEWIRERYLVADDYNVQAEIEAIFRGEPVSETTMRWFERFAWLANNIPLIETEAEHAEYCELAAELWKKAPGERGSLEFASSPEGQMALMLFGAIIEYEKSLPSPLPN